VGRLRERLIARQDRDFARSDAIRAEVEGAGFGVKDTAQGTVLERYS
jgi:cysteinyl-tRNA synthetase